LLAHPELNLSFPAAIFADYHDTKPATRIYGDYDTADAIIPFNDMMHRPRGWIALASCLIRQDAKNRLLDFLKARPYLTVGDIYFQFFGSEPKGALYFARPMSLYRYRTPQSWTSKTHADTRFKVTHEIAMIRSYLELYQITGNAYHNDFLALILQRLLWLFAAPLPTENMPSCITLLKQLHTACTAQIDQTLMEFQQAPAARYVIFGCASGCQKILNSLSNKNIAAIIDRDNLRIGESIQGKPVIGTMSLEQYADCTLIISTIPPASPALFQMTDHAGIPRKNVHHLFDGAIEFLNNNPIPLDIFER
jgi:hypothetical protein